MVMMPPTPIPQRTASFMSDPRAGGPAQPADSGPLKRLNNPTNFSSSIRYPTNIETVDHFLKIRHGSKYGDY